MKRAELEEASTPTVTAPGRFPGIGVPKVPAFCGTCEFSGPLAPPSQTLLEVWGF